MKISVLCNDGSPLGVCESTIEGDNFRVGVGGSELALLTMCKLWKEAGHDIVLYNNPHPKGTSSFEQCPISAFNPNEDRDILIVFRSPNPRAIIAKGKRVWWSCDQYTIGDFRQFSGYMDKVVCISPFHAEYFKNTYGIDNVVVIDLPVRMEEFELEIERKKNHLIFSSVPDRGLHNLWRIYPKIKDQIPDLSITITSDYRLWGASELNQIYRTRWLVREDVEFLGAISRSRYIQELFKSSLMVYPCTYDELFCYSVAEAQCAGVPCITTAKGALATTNMGYIYWIDPSDNRNDRVIIDHAVQLFSNPAKMDIERSIIVNMARDRFDPKRILAHWDKHVFGENNGK